MFNVCSNFVIFHPPWHYKQTKLNVMLITVLIKGILNHYVRQQVFFFK